MKKKYIVVLFLLLLGFSRPPARDDDAWAAGVDKVGNIVSILENSYYKDLDQDRLAYASIRGMLETLDPHSYFLDPDYYSRMREEYTGRFYGLGIQITKQEDRLVIVGVVEGTPAYRLGLQIGDIISHINGESTKPITSYDAMMKLRGEKGTKVNVTIVRDGLDKPLELTVVREEIPLNSVPYAFILENGIGYVFIRNFAETTDSELSEKLASLTRQGMKSLILDLRWNTGGPLVQSIQVSDEFLPKGTLVVSMRGRNKNYNRDFHAFRDNQYEKLPLVILVNEGTASASEIVSGAVMDHDRGLIVGEDSWGKGLVQSVIPLASNMAVALTTAKYLTPSGRSIQRDYSHIEDYMMNKKAADESREIRYTAKGRKVLGQGGITPDIKVEFTLKPLTGRMILAGAFFNYARRLAHHQTDLSKKLVLPQDEKKAEVPAGKILVGDSFAVNADTIEDFKSHLKTLKFAYEDKDFQEAEGEIKRELEREVYSALYGAETGQRIYRLSDPVVRKAVEVMPESAKFVE